MEDSFNVKVAFFKYSDDAYSYTYETVTSRDDIRSLLKTVGGKTYSMHIGEGVVIFANPVMYEEIGHMTANLVDAEGAQFFWGGNFIVCNEVGSAPSSVDEKSLKYALSVIRSNYLDRIRGTINDTESI